MISDTKQKLKICLLVEEKVVSISLISISKFTLHFLFDKEGRHGLSILAFEK